MSNEIITHSDPICSSAGCNYKSAKSAHPMDYFVPNFGMDQDIMDSQSHESASRTTLMPKSTNPASESLVKPSSLSHMNLELHH